LRGQFNGVVASPAFRPKALPSSPVGRHSAAVYRRIACASLLCAWMCASGALLDVTQAVAWTGMFAARETFDPAKPCSLCRAVSRAREASEPRCPVAPAAASEKLILIFETPLAFIPRDGRGAWPVTVARHGSARAGEVPVPPPRGSELAA
jgi:hypothetical protein